METYTQEQIEYLCSALELRAQEIYADLGGFKPNATPKSYALLASVINEGTSDKQIWIKEEWLRSLFYYRRYEANCKLSKPLLDQVCQFLGAKNTFDFFAQLNRVDYPCYGTYNIHWKSTTLSSANIRVSVDYKLLLSANGSVFEPLNGNGTRYVGPAAIVLEGNAYIELMHPGGLEKVYLILHVGIADAEDLGYISGLFLAVDANPHPCSGLILAVRTEVSKVNQNLIEEYFNRFPVPLIKAVTIDRIRKMQEDLSIKSTENHDSRLQGLYGVFKVYTRVSDKMLIDMGKLEINGKKQLRYESEDNSYRLGALKVIGGTNLIIEMWNDLRMASITIDIKHSQRLDKFEFWPGVYMATGAVQPGCGLVYLERTHEAFEDISVAELAPNDPVLKKMHDRGYLEEMLGTKNIRMPQSREIN